MPRIPKCANPACRAEFTRQRIGQKVCSPGCAIELTKLQKAKVARKETAQKKKEAWPRRKWVKSAQAAFNAFIRERDKGLPCICCGKYAVEGIYGGSWDAGHFLTVGACPELRFTEDNCHKQLKSCNAGSGKYTAKGKTVSQSYRENLIKKIGLERVEWLEGPHPPQKWTIEELQEIRRVYTGKLKQLTGKLPGVAP